MIVIINLISDTLSYLSAYMMNALYISVIKDDLHDAMGFRQSLMRVVRIVANLAGAFLINVMSIQTISLINTLTFVIAFWACMLFDIPCMRLKKGLKCHIQH